MIICLNRFVLHCLKADRVKPRIQANQCRSSVTAVLSSADSRSPGPISGVVTPRMSAGSLYVFDTLQSPRLAATITKTLLRLYELHTGLHRAS